jgi:hypothetical protein
VSSELFLTIFIYDNDYRERKDTKFLGGTSIILTSENTLPTLQSLLPIALNGTEYFCSNSDLGTSK